MYRLASAYVSIIVRSITHGSLMTYECIAKPVIASVYHGRREVPDFDEGITFRKFAEWVCLKTAGYICDPLWRPQGWYVNPEDMDYIGKLEQFASDF